MPVHELTTAVADLIPGHHESRRREHSNDAGRRPRLTPEQPTATSQARVGSPAIWRKTRG